MQSLQKSTSLYQRCTHRNHSIVHHIQILEFAPDNSKHAHDPEAMIHCAAFLSKTLSLVAADSIVSS